MPLPSFVTDLNTVPEAIRDEYEKQDDGYILKVDGKDFAVRIKEYRENNIKLDRERREAIAKAEKFKDIDPEKYKKAMEAQSKIDKLDEADLIKDGKLDDVFNKRTQTMREDFTNQLSTKEKLLKEKDEALGTLNGKYRDLLLDSTIRDTIDAVGVVKKGAISDIIRRAKDDWIVDADGTLTAKDANGKQKYGKDGEPLTMVEWAKTLLQAAPYLFEPGTGGGARGAARSNANAPKGKMRNPSALDIGKNMAAIASGKVEVRRDGVDYEDTED